eukprot:6477349-Amphidinium_carterae.1
MALDEFDFLKSTAGNSSLEKLVRMAMSPIRNSQQGLGATTPVWKQTAEIGTLCQSRQTAFGDSLACLAGRLRRRAWYGTHGGDVAVTSACQHGTAAT